MKSSKKARTNSPGKFDYWHRDVSEFRRALHIQMQRCGETLESLLPAAAGADVRIHDHTIVAWVRDKTAPCARKAFEFLPEDKVAQAAKILNSVWIPDGIKSARHHFDLILPAPPSRARARMGNS